MEINVERVEDLLEIAITDDKGIRTHSPLITLDTWREYFNEKFSTATGMFKRAMEITNSMIEDMMA